MIGSAVALDPEYVPPGKFRVDHSQIDEEPGESNLRTHVITFRLQGCGDLFFEDAVVLTVVGLGDAHAPGAGEIQKQLERGNALAAAALQVDVFVCNGA